MQKSRESIDNQQSELLQNNEQLNQKIQDIINWVKSDIAIEENVKLGRTSTPYRREKMRFLYKLEKMLS